LRISDCIDKTLTPRTTAIIVSTDASLGDYFAAAIKASR